MLNLSHIMLSRRLIRAVALAALLMLGQWLALAHACDLGVSTAAHQVDHSPPEHGDGDAGHGDALCSATANVGDELVDALLSPVMPEAADIPPALDRLPRPASAALATPAAFLPNSRASPHPLALYGRLRI